MKPLQSNSFHILKAICMSGNCTSHICSPKKSKEKLLGAKKWSWSRKEKSPHNPFHTHSAQASSSLLRSNIILPRKNPLLSIIFKLHIKERREQSAKLAHLTSFTHPKNNPETCRRYTLSGRATETGRTTRLLYTKHYTSTDYFPPLHRKHRQDSGPQQKTCRP